MSNYRVRQVLALGPLPDRQLRLLVALATWMNDENKTIKVSFGIIAQDMGRSIDTAKRARRDAVAAGQITYTSTRGRGHVTSWTVDCLPGKGVQRSAPFSGDGKRVQPSGEKGGNGSDKRMHIPSSDQDRNAQGLDLVADASSALGPPGPPGQAEHRLPLDEVVSMAEAMAEMRTTLSKKRVRR